MVEDWLPSAGKLQHKELHIWAHRLFLNRCVYSSVKTLLLFAQLDSSLPDDQNQPVCKRCVLIPTVKAESQIKVKR